MAILIQLKQVSKVYGTGHTAVTALYPTDFTLKAGEFAAIIGPSGSGKTTLLTIIGNLQRPSNGQIIVNHQDTTHLNEGQRTDLRFNTFGFILQASNLIPFLTVKDQLALVDRFNHHHKHETTMSALLTCLALATWLLITLQLYLAANGNALPSREHCTTIRRSSSPMSQLPVSTLSAPCRSFSC